MALGPAGTLAYVSMSGQFHPKDVAFVNNIAIAAAVGAITGGVVGGVLSAAQGGTFSDGFASGMMTGLVSGAIAGGIAGYNSGAVPAGVTGEERYAVNLVLCGVAGVVVFLIFREEIFQLFKEQFPGDNIELNNQGVEPTKINSSQPEQGNQCVA